MFFLSWHALQLHAFYGRNWRFHALLPRLFFFWGKVTYTPRNLTNWYQKMMGLGKGIETPSNMAVLSRVFARPNARSRKLIAERWMRIDGTGGECGWFHDLKGGEKFDPGFPGTIQVLSLIFVVSFSLEQIPDGEVLDGKLGSLDGPLDGKSFFFGGSQVVLVGSWFCMRNLKLVETTPPDALGRGMLWCSAVDVQVGWRPLWCQGGLGGWAKAARAVGID